MILGMSSSQENVKFSVKEDHVSLSMKSSIAVPASSFTILVFSSEILCERSIRLKNIPTVFFARYLFSKCMCKLLTHFLTVTFLEKVRELYIFPGYFDPRNLNNL